jgi:hypothetical protein
MAHLIRPAEEGSSARSMTVLPSNFSPYFIPFCAINCAPRWMTGVAPVIWADAALFWQHRCSVRFPTLRGSAIRTPALAFRSSSKTFQDVVQAASALTLDAPRTYRS